MEANAMEHTVERTGECLIVKIAGRLDAQTAPTLEEAIEEELEGVTEVTFDLEGLDYLSSAGLRILFAAFKLMGKRNGTMRILNVGDEVRNVLDMSGFSAIFSAE